MKVVKEDIKKAARCLQLCAGQEVGCEAAIQLCTGYLNPTKQWR